MGAVGAGVGLLLRICGTRPAEHVAKCLRDEERLQADVVALQQDLQVFDSPEELHLGIVEVVGEVAQPLRVEKGDALLDGLVFGQQPEDEVGTEAGLGEEADRLVRAVVAQEVEFCVFQHARGRRCG